MLPPPGLLGEFVIHSCAKDDGSLLLTPPMWLCRKPFQVACFDHTCVIVSDLIQEEKEGPDFVLFRNIVFLGQSG